MSCWPSLHHQSQMVVLQEIHLWNLKGDKTFPLLKNGEDVYSSF